MLIYDVLLLSAFEITQFVRMLFCDFAFIANQNFLVDLPNVTTIVDGLIGYKTF